MMEENSVLSELDLLSGANEQENVDLAQEETLEEVNVELAEKLQDSKVTITKLQAVTVELEKQKALLEKEVTNLRKSAENAVIRYATSEKSILDSKLAREAAEKKNKDFLREIELLNGKIKASAADKSRICGILDGKCHELIKVQKETERLKYENTGLDSKLKWHLSKLKIETELREASDKKVEELTAEINQLKLQETNRAKEDVGIERNLQAEKQMIEQNATLILLKHDNDEKTRRIEAFEKKCQQLQTDLEALNVKYADLGREHEVKSLERSQMSAQMNDLQNLIDKQMLKIAELQSNQNDLEIIRTQLSLEKESNRELTANLNSLTVQIEEQNLETEKWRANEIELLQLNKELTELNVRLRNESSMLNSKQTAVTLENEMIKKDKSYYENIVRGLQDQLDEEITKRNTDCQLLAKHLSEKTKSANNLQKKVEEVTGELEAQQKKHSQAIKELTRELNLLRKKTENTSSATKQSPTPSTASDSSTESRASEYPTISLEPSQKSLIDRIVRLQNEIVRQSEKIDFLENHQAQLLLELKRLRKK